MESTAISRSKGTKEGNLNLMTETGDEFDSLVESDGSFHKLMFLQVLDSFSKPQTMRWFGQGVVSSIKMLPQ